MVWVMTDLCNFLFLFVPFPLLSSSPVLFLVSASPQVSGYIRCPYGVGGNVSVDLFNMGDPISCPASAIPQSMTVMDGECALLTHINGENPRWFTVSCRQHAAAWKECQITWTCVITLVLLALGGARYS